VVIDEQTKIRQKFIVANISFKSRATENGNLWKKIYLEKANRDIQQEFPKASALLGHYSTHQLFDKLDQLAETDRRAENVCLSRWVRADTQDNVKELTDVYTHLEQLVDDLDPEVLVPLVLRELEKQKGEPPMPQSQHVY
jgi:hypothetical protein